MVTQAVIEEVKNRLVKAYDPIAIYLFGSYAWGKPDEDSDLDILIVVEKSDEKSYKRPVRGYDVLSGLGVSKDLIVHTKEEFDRSLASAHTLCAKIARDGRLLYAKS
jgi:predicted nucleotidyltransferase